MSDLDYLLNELLSGDDGRAESAAGQLSATGDDALAALAGLLETHNADGRWWVVRALAEFKGKRASALLVQALSDPNPDVVKCAALGLRRNPDPDAVPILVKLMQEGDSLLGRLAANALIAIGASSVPPLLELVEGESSAAQLEAARALAMIGDTRAIPVLFKAFDRDSALLEFWADEGLDRMGVGMAFFKP